MPEVIQLHRQQLRPGDVTSKYGVAVTKPLKTIADLLVEGVVPRKYLIEAVAAALEQKLILPSEIAKSKLTANEKKLVEVIIRVALKRSTPKSMPMA
ncbi:MAG: hypothetical protein P4L53_14660 [Candidatus Obscuribacterales bacterium]|nr:hypothetical protein [Candidatus Obscuribacterales bacterium]